MHLRDLFENDSEHFARMSQTGFWGSAGAGCLFLARSTGRFLFAHRSEDVNEGGTWGTWGGAIDRGENPEEAVRREADEEAGKTGHFSFVPLYVFHDQKNDFRYYNFLVLVDNEFEPKLNWENQGYRWCDFGEWPQPLHFGIPGILGDPKSVEAMRTLSERFKAKNLTEAELPEPHNPKNIDPALLTFKEYYQLMNPDEKWHSSRAYETDLDTLKDYDKGKFPKVIRRLKKNGLMFEVRLRSERCRYIKLDADRAPLRDENGALVYYTEEECRLLNKPLEEHTLAIFDDKDRCIAMFSDEWGCVLIRVADEYKGFGFGPFLAKMGRTIYPSRGSGGFTNSGFNNFRKVHRMFVSDALTSGRYRELVRQGKLTTEKAKEIIASAGLPQGKQKADEINLSSKDPSDWMMMANGYGEFIIYDRKLRDLYEADGRFDFFTDEMIIGMIYVAAGERYGIVNAYGGETKNVRSLLLRCALTHCANEGVTLVIDQEDIDDVDPRYISISERSVASGHWRHEAQPVGPLLDYRPMVIEEAAFRRTFDRYDEFKDRVQEAAYGKFRND